MSIQVAAQIMAALDVGALPVSDTGQLVGMTVRTRRLLDEGKAPDHR